MFRKRVIPCLLLRSGGLVKTCRFCRPDYIGDPINAVKIFNEKGVDELILLDIEASAIGRDPDMEMVRNIATECFMPLCYGGGVRSVGTARVLFAAGVEKVSVNSAALDRPELVHELATEFGSQSVVAGLDVGRNWTQRACVRHSGKRKMLSRCDPCEWAGRLQQLGAGELLLNVVHCDGMRSGYDLELVRQIQSAVEIPVIACGGAGSTDHIRKLFQQTGVSAAAAGSLFVYSGADKGVLINYPAYDSLRQLCG